MRLGAAFRHGRVCNQRQCSEGHQRYDQCQLADAARSLSELARGIRIPDGVHCYVPQGHVGCRMLIGTALPLCEYRADQAVNRNLPAANKSSDISRPLQAAGGSPVSCRSRIRRQILRPRSTFRAIALGDGPLHRIRAANEKTFGLVGVEGLDRLRGRVVELPWKMRKVTTPSQAVTVAVCDRGGHRLAYSRPPSPESLMRACRRELFDGR